MGISGAGQGHVTAGAMRQNALPGFLLTYALFYGAYGCISPFLPNFLQEHGLSAGEIASVLAAATLMRLVAGPLAGRLADHLGATRAVLTVSAGFTGLITFAYLAGYGFWPLLLVSLAYAIATAPLAPLADALALAASAGGRAFQYGWVRGAGSAAFILATVAIGRLVEAFGLTVIVAASAALFLITALSAAFLPSPEARPEAAETGIVGGFRALFAIPVFRRLVLVAALVIGAHAMHDAFGMLVWTGAGIAPSIASLLWAESVAAEVIVFLLLGRPLLDRLGPAGAMALAAVAGALRWAVMAETTALPALAAIQLLHGLTFALLHLACVRLIGDIVPAGLSATALTIYGTFGLGLASAGLTLASGPLFASFGAQAFWAMAALSLAGVPLALSVRGAASDAAGGRPREA